ncbi:putative Ig domain-containing protein [Cellulomonas triticagri]|uniref:Ig-like domain-containing protein n=1 Tax=Cellulomonas triticagri TaxID=2483352 RepID=A0A3M2JCK8_9CELL|nr:putative Ig domain-containing protein [Cellulomonas triticagri]RMI08695.1 hypothetical protein EBM89_13490 [Cellulomonas triticagri]
MLHSRASRRPAETLLGVLLVCALAAAGLVVTGAAPARAHATGLVVDPAFDAGLGGGFNSSVFSVAPTEPDGYVVAGFFTRYGGVSAPYLARLDADLELDTDFAAALGSGFNSWVSVALPVDGGYLVGGNFSLYQRRTAPRLVRLDADLRIDEAFSAALGTGFDGAVRAVVPDGDGFVVGGSFTRYQGRAVPRLVRLDADLRIDEAFLAALGTGFDDDVRVVVPADGGGYLVGGNFTRYRGEAAAYLVRLDARLEPDTAFHAALGTGFDGNVRVVVPDGDGYYVGGSFTRYRGEAVPHLVRLDADLVPDPGFQLVGSFSDTVFSVVPHDGAYVVAGDFTTPEGARSAHLLRLVTVVVEVDAVADRVSSAGFPVVPVPVAARVEPATAGTPVLTVSGLPDGLTFDRGTSTITGTPSVVTGTTTSRVTVSATASGVTDTTTFTWTVEPPPPPVVDLEPTDVHVLAGTDARFTAAGSGDPTPTVQWFTRDGADEDAGPDDGWQAVAGATAPELVVVAPGVADRGRQYRAEFRNAHGVATTRAATLVVETVPRIVTAPSHQTVVEGDTATFAGVYATDGLRSQRRLWLRSTDGGATYEQVGGGMWCGDRCRTSVEVATADRGADGDLYVLAITYLDGTRRVESAPARLTVLAQRAPQITVQPESVTLAVEGADLVFTAAATGVPEPTVQWFLLDEDGGDPVPISGATDPTLVLTATADLQGRSVVAEFTNRAGTATTFPATVVEVRPGRALALRVTPRVVVVDALPARP